MQLLPTMCFVLLWSSGALAARIGLDHASPFLFLAARLGLALALLLALGGWRMPVPGSRRLVVRTGLLLVAGYSSFYLFALQGGVTPGVLATLLGVQPILTLLLTERPFRRSRLGGLALALAGLLLVVFDSLAASRFAAPGLLAAFAALACMTWGTLLQKRSSQAPIEVLPLQYATGLVVVLLLLATESPRWDGTPALWLSVCWLAGVISVAATLLLYRLIQRGNLVNVTSLFYLVPGGTAVLDWVVLGNAMAAGALAGLALIVAGLVAVYRVSPGAPSPRA